ncbi:MAG: flagellar protein export ATPase FliI [Alphaproteobacteria bacterium]|nr:flagellar protein export ATPase FliI [Alphaproteobacteria bacterium SS10]
MSDPLIDSFKHALENADAVREYGRVTAILGMVVEVAGIQHALAIGSRCDIEARDGRIVPAEVVGFRERKALMLAYGALEGIGLGCQVEVSHDVPLIYPSDQWLGRIINAMGQPVDGAGALPEGVVGIPFRNNPPPAHARQRIGDKIDVGVRGINTFLTCCRGQRMGIFSGSGVGKSTLLSMMARETNADVIVIGLVGERGREVQEFIEDDLGPEGLKRAVVVVATSDEPAVMRRQAAYTTLSVCEYFRDQGLDVLCLMDSVTRFAMAQREIGLSAGEPPTSKGYPPTTFSELAKLLERAGPGESDGSITGLFSVLVEGDDHNEPIADAVRGIIDGHIMLDREIAERGRYPAINVLRSVSRTMPDCNTPAQNDLVSNAKRLVSSYENMAELIRLGAYRKGSDPEVDLAIDLYPGIEDFIRQNKGDPTDLERGYELLAGVLGTTYGEGAGRAVLDGEAPATELTPEGLEPPQPGQGEAIPADPVADIRATRMQRRQVAAMAQQDPASN